MATSTAGLQIVLSAEVDRAIAALNGVEQAFHDMGEEAERALQDAQGAIQDLGRGNVSIRRLEAALRAFRAASVNTTDINALQEYNRNIQLLETEIHRLSNLGRDANNNLPGAGNGANRAATSLQNLGRVASDAPFGFIAIQNNLDPLIDSFRRLSLETGSAQGAFRALGSALLGSAGIALGFTLISSAITTVIQKYGSLGKAFEAWFGQLSAIEKAQRALTEATIKGAQAAQDELTHLGSLMRATQNVNIPLSERNKIVDELQRLYPTYFKNLSNEAILAGNAASAYETLRQSIIAAAKAKALEDLVAEQTKQIAKAEIEQSQAIQKRVAAQEKLNKLRKEASFIDEVLQPFSGLIPSDLNQANQQVFNLGRTIAKTADQISESQKQVDAINQVFDRLIETAPSASEALGITAETAKSTGKSISDIIKELQNDLKGLDAAFLATGGSLRDLTEDKIKKYGQTLAELSKRGLSADNPIFQNVLRDVQSLQNVLSRPVVARIPITIEPLPAADNANVIAKVMDGVEAQFAPQLNTFTKTVNALIQTTLVDGVGSIADALGTALAGGDFGGILQAFAGVISSFLTSLGKTLIVNGLAIEAFKKSLQTLQGIPAIIAGGALIAAAAAFRSLAGKGVNRFATGGIAVGEQLAIVGDNPSGREAIIPEEMWGEIGGMGDMELTTKISGSDLLILVKRADREQKRFN